jgi:methylglutaconyl-CoA hydratase
MSQSELVLFDHSDPQIAVVTLNRPEKRNAMSIALIEALHRAVLEAAKDPVRRVLIFRGNGPSFCAGLDLAEVAVPENAHRSAESLCKLYESVATSPLVTIAAAHGGAFGGGAGLIAASDIVVAAEDLKIGYPEVRRGLVAALVTALMRRQLGDRAVRELILLGMTVDAKQSLALGLVNRVVPNTNLMHETTAIAKTACLGAPGAVVRTKQLLDAQSPRPVTEELRRALAFHLDARHSTEAKEGVAAFLEKREPRWGPRET